jgi:hypothetical protein
MTFDGISRRELLAGLTGVSAAGALTGLGTGALLSDTEGLAAGLSGGALDLEVTWSYPGSGASESNVGVADVPSTEAGTERTVDITVDLPQGETDFNNAAFVWVRLLCPEESDIPTDDVRVELSYADGDLDGESILGPATLTDLLSEESGDGALTGLPLLASAENACLDTRDGGEPIRLALRIAVAAEYVGETAFHLPFEFVGHQCRHATATENPFARAPVGPCGSVGGLREPASESDESTPTEEPPKDPASPETETATEPTPEKSSPDESTPEDLTPEKSSPEASTPGEPTPDESTPEESTETETTTEQQSTKAQHPTDEQSTETTGTPDSTTESSDPSVGGGRA